MSRHAPLGSFPRWTATLGCVALGAALLGCRTGGGQALENWSPTVPASKFKVIGTLATSDAGMDIRMMVQVREDLQHAGLNAVRVSGRFDNIADAVTQLCAPGVDQPIDGVLAVAYNDLVLYDCETHKPAYEIRSGSLGLPNLTKRLIRYLKSKPAGT